MAFRKARSITNGFGGHNCNDCANAVKIGENVKCISHEQILVEQIVILYLVGWVEILYFIEIIMDKHYLFFPSLVMETE